MEYIELFDNLDSEMEIFGKIALNDLASNPDMVDIIIDIPYIHDWNALSLNENDQVIEIISRYPNKINWKNLSRNSCNKAIELLQANPEKINWEYLSLNSNDQAIHMLLLNPDKINWYGLYANTNPNVIELYKNNSGYHYPLRFNQATYKYAHLYLRMFPEEITKDLSSNPESGAIQLLIEYPQMIDWSKLSNNPCPIALDILKDNLDKIDMHAFCCNKNPDILIILRNHPYLISGYLSGNRNNEAIELLKFYPDRIDWNFLSSNPCEAALDLLYYLGRHAGLINYNQLSKNKNPRAVELLEEHIDAINWFEFCKYAESEKAVQLMRKHIDRVSWISLSMNKSIYAMKFLSENFDCICWENLCCNESDHAMEIIKQFPEYIIWEKLIMNKHSVARSLLKEKLLSFGYKNRLIQSMNQVHANNITTQNM